MEEGFAIGREIGSTVTGGVDHVVVVSTIHIRISKYEKPKALNIRQFDFRETALGCSSAKREEEEEEEEEAKSQI